MIALWYKEWREFTGNRRRLAVRLLLPLLLLTPLLRPESLRMPALAGVVVYLGAYGTATQVARERISGYLPRLALTPVPPSLIVLHRVLCRVLLLALQMAPLLALAAWFGAPPGQLALFLPALPAACAAGALIGLRAPSRRGAQLAGLLTALAAFGAGWNTGPVPAPAEVMPGVAAMSAAGSSLPSQALLWLLAIALLGGALHAAPAILGTSEES